VDDFEPVAFITVESGDDLIVSFFVVKPDDPTDGRSLILMRDRKWENSLPEWERGVKVSDEAYSDDEEWEDNFLERIRLGNSTAEIISKHYRHKLDLRKVERSELRAAKKLLKKMNHDKRFKLEVA
jgi:hypothetical protein